MGKTIISIDVAVIGGGFSGMFAVYRLRGLGFKVKGFERGASFGGTWYWNRYLGARVDSEVPIYQFSDKALWSNFTFSEKYPARKEILRYFDYVDLKWNLRKDFVFNAEVTSACFDESQNMWIVSFNDDREVHARWFLPCAGFASKQYVPKFNGMDNFKGICYHSGSWPDEDPDFTNKSVGIIGTGATGVQIIQEVGPVAGHLTVFQRTPTLATPMQQKSLTEVEEKSTQKQDKYEEVFNGLLKNWGGFPFDFSPQKTSEVDPSVRRLFFEDLYKQGSFGFWLGGYKDLLYESAANNEAYQFWKEKTRERITDPAKKAIVAPDVAPHPFGTKRVPLEQNYFDVLDRPNVEIVDVSERGFPIESITENGIKTTDGKEYEFDVLILATGFDTNTGGMAQMNITGLNKASLKENWGNGNIMTYMGLCAHDYPNMFWSYGTHGPTAFSNGPTCVEIQLKWAIEVISYCRKNRITRFNPSTKSEETWVKHLSGSWNSSLMPLAKSWYQGANIPGKKVQPLNYSGGIPRYREFLVSESSSNYSGFLQTKTNAGVVARLKSVLKRVRERSVSVVS